MREELYPLQDVEAVSNADASGLHSYLQVVSPVVSGLSSVVNLLVVQVGMPGEYFVDDRIVFLQRAKEILLLHEVQTDGFVPVELANALEKLLVLGS